MKKEQIQRVVARVDNALDDMSRRADDAVKRFEKKRSRVTKDTTPGDHEYELQLHAAQVGILSALGHVSWFFKNPDIVALGPQAENEHKIYLDPTGLFEAKSIIEAAKSGDRFARYALHNKLSNDIDDGLPIIQEYQKYLHWLLWNTREGTRRKGRLPKLNHHRDLWIRNAVGIAMSHGFKPTRNRASERPSAASLVADALAEFGIHMTEANVELIAKEVDPKKSED